MKLVIEARICMKKLTVDGHGESARWIGWRDELYWAAQLPTWMDKMHEEIDCRLSWLKWPAIVLEKDPHTHYKC